MFRSKISKNIQFCLILTFFVLLISPFTFGGSEVIFIKSEGPKNLFILSIGVDEYDDPKIGDLRLAKSDAKAIAKEFTEHGKFNYVKIVNKTLLDKSPGQSATRDGIIAALDEIASEITPDDVFIFSFAGSGHAIKVGEKQEFYLFPADFKLDSPPQTGISSTLLQAYFRRIRAGKKLVILDSCYSAAGYEDASSAFVEDDASIADLINENVLFIGTDTESFEKGDHGTITQIVLDALRGDADFNGDGNIGTYELEAQIYIGGMKAAVANKWKFHPRTILRGENFDIAFTDKKLREKTAEFKKDEENKNNAAASGKDTSPTRAELAVPKQEKQAVPRNGDDYALLFANDGYDNADNWKKLKNPKSDVCAIAAELKNTYGYQGIVIKYNLTVDEITDTLKSLTQQKFAAKSITSDAEKVCGVKYPSFDDEDFEKKDNQLLVFFAGHGVGDEYSNGYLVGRDSPAFSEKTKGAFVSIENVFKIFDNVKVNHYMFVFDACFSGNIFKPSLQPKPRNSAFLQNTNIEKQIPRYYGLAYYNDGLTENGLTENKFPGDYFIEKTREQYIRENMGERTKLVFTSGDEPVLDARRLPDGTLSDHSPFAEKFLEALHAGGRNHDVLLSAEITPFVKILEPTPIDGPLPGSEGEFVFIKSINTQR